MVATLSRHWRGFWFPAIPLGRVALLRILLCAYVLGDLLFESRWMSRYAGVAQEFYEPIFVLRFLDLPRLGADGMQIVWLVLLAAAFLALVGLATRPALAGTAALYLYWFATYHSYGWVWHFKVVPTVALFVLAIAPSGRAYSLDATIARRRGAGDSPDRSDQIAGWACQFLVVVLFCHYFGSALQKLRLSGPDWWTAGAFEQAIHGLGTPFARQLAEHHLWAVDAMALSVFAFELCAPLLLFKMRVRMWYAGAAIAFHLSTLWLLGLNFLGWAVVCTVVFPLERVPAFIRNRVLPSAGLMEQPRVWVRSLR